MDEKIWSLIFDNIQKILFPEIWLIMDLSISKMELMALLLIWRNDEIIMSQLADSLNIPMSTATGVVSRLAKKGFVERIVDESNRRIVTVKLTKEGKDTAAAVKQTFINYWDYFAKILSDDEKSTLFNIVAKVIALFDKEEFANVGVEEKPIKKIKIE